MSRQLPSIPFSTIAGDSWLSGFVEALSPAAAANARQLRILKEARDWLQKAFELGDPKKINLMAPDDPDLEPLLREFGEV